MVEVSLLKLVGIVGTIELWPSQFAAMVAKCEENPDDRTTFGVLADWCDDRDEAEYGRAWRWLFKRPMVVDEYGKTSGVTVRQYTCGRTGFQLWEVFALPSSVVVQFRTNNYDNLAHLVAALANRITEMEKEIEA
jgi:hypothetical protein